MNDIIWSHSKLSTLLTCPATYNVVYNHKVLPKFEKEALSLGSAVHWGIENNTEDLNEYYKDNKYKKDEQIMAESMVSGYLKYKDELLNKVLDGLDLLDEQHELELIGNLKSNIIKEHKFKGIIDYLLLTENGFIVIDFKTSSSIPDWDNYLDQLYRYIYLLKCEFPDIPVYKLAIINLRKCKIKRKTGENDNSFRKRLSVVYQLNDEKHIDMHVYKDSELNVKNIDYYISNLSKQCDAGLSIINSNSYYINYKALDDYGGSLFKELLLNNEGSYTLYNIKDKYINELNNEIENVRDMRQIDLEKIMYNINTCSSYKDFENDIERFKNQYNINILEYDKDSIFKYLIEYLNLIYDKIDKELISNYLDVYYLLKN